MGKNDIRLAIFDFDSTLMDGETIDFLAKSLGVESEVSSITKKAMEGELDFFEALNKRVKLLKGLEFSKAKEICQNLPFMEGAKECITELKRRGIKVIVFSGGFHLATSYAKDILGFDGEFANELHVKNDLLSGLVGGEMMFGYSKGVMLKKLQDILHVKKEQTISIGDGANDISMFAHSAFRVSFCGKKALEERANIIIREKDLRQILEHI
ncbi:MAG: phosphoserine phosphatase SerB [Proteobacteria bacterium]|nr:MAG: phosphoserine phosphatase SerB [Pseudomonadota bacterium]